MPSESIEEIVRNVLEAEEIVLCMHQANRTRQLFNLKLGQPPNLELPFPLDRARSGYRPCARGSRLPIRFRITRTAITVRPNLAASSASDAVPSKSSSDCFHRLSPQRSGWRKLPFCLRTASLRSTSDWDNFLPRTFAAPLSLRAR